MIDRIIAGDLHQKLLIADPDPYIENLDLLIRIRILFQLQILLRATDGEKTQIVVSFN